MSKPTSPQTWAGATKEIMAAFGVETAAAIIERGTTTVYNYGDPDNPSLPTGPQMAMWDAAYVYNGHGSEGPFHRLMRRLHTEAVNKAPPIEHGEPMELITKMLKEVGEGISHFHDVAQEVRVSPAQVIRTERELIEISKVVDEMLKMVRGMTEHCLREVI